MKTNVHYLEKKINYPSDQTGITCSISAMLSFDNNPVMFAVVKNNIEQVSNMLESKNAYALNGAIYFKAFGYAHYKDGDELDIIKGKQVAEDKAQTRAMEKAHNIYKELVSIVDNALKFSEERVYALSETTANMIAHVEEITR